MEFPKGFHPRYLDEEFFQFILSKVNPEAKLVNFHQSEVDSRESILTTLAEASSQEKNIENFTGFSRFNLNYEEKSKKGRKSVVIKSKRSASFIQSMVLDFAKPAGPEMEAIFEEHVQFIIPGHTEHKEIELYNLDVPCIQSICPEVYYTFKDTDKDIYFIVMEDLSDGGFELLNCVSKVDDWTEKDVLDILQGLAPFHAYYLDRTEAIPHQLKHWLLPKVTPACMLKKKAFLQALMDHNSKKAPEFYPPEVCVLLNKLIGRCELVYNILFAVPYTLCHDDVGPRNLCMRKDMAHSKKRLCLYDWEVVRESICVRDIVDCLANILPGNASPDLWRKYRDQYYRSLADSLKEFNNYKEEISQFMEEENFSLIFDLAVVDLVIDRYAFYMFSHVYRPHDFFVRVMKNAIAYAMSIKDRLNALLSSA